MAAFVLLIGLQFAVTCSSDRARLLAMGEPLVLLYRSGFVPAPLWQARVTEDEVRAAVRSAGVEPLEQVRAVVLETDGSFSVVWPSEGGDGSSLVCVDGSQEFREPTER